MFGLPAATFIRQPFGAAFCYRFYREFFSDFIVETLQI